MVRTHGGARLRAIVIVISVMPELCDGPEPTCADTHNRGAPMNAAREPDGAVIVTVADGDA